MCSVTVPRPVIIMRGHYLHGAGLLSGRINNVELHYVVNGVDCGEVILEETSKFYGWKILLRFKQIYKLYTYNKEKVDFYVRFGFYGYHNASCVITLP